MRGNMSRTLNLLAACVAVGFLNSCAVVAVGAVGAAAATGAAVGTDPRSGGALVDDNSIQSKLSGKYGNSDNFPDSNIYVDVFNKSVLLTGQVKDDAQKQFAENIARGYPGVIKIYDYLNVRLPSSMGSRSTDSMITTQLKTQLLTASGVPSNSIKVVTTETVIYMMGMVTPAEAESAANVAAKVGGASKVVTLFDYKSNK
ncbi:MAG: BON domain-containing protein [Neisseriales bacterium]|nr:MAG: BON domain-containing protein [Neisseriales bacterium]